MKEWLGADLLVDHLIEGLKTIKLYDSGVVTSSTTRARCSTVPIPPLLGKKITEIADASLLSYFSATLDKGEVSRLKTVSPVDGKEKVFAMVPIKVQDRNWALSLSVPTAEVNQSITDS